MRWKEKSKQSFLLRLKPCTRLTCWDSVHTHTPLITRYQSGNVSPGVIQHQHLELNGYVTELITVLKWQESPWCWPCPRSSLGCAPPGPRCPTSRPWTCTCGLAPSLSSCQSLSTQPWTTSPQWRQGRYCLLLTVVSFPECEKDYPHLCPLLTALRPLCEVHVPWQDASLWGDDNLILNFILSALCWLVSSASSFTFAKRFSVWGVSLSVLPSTDSNPWKEGVDVQITSFQVDDDDDNNNS